MQKSWVLRSICLQGLKWQIQGWLEFLKQQRNTLLVQSILSLAEPWTRLMLTTDIWYEHEPNFLMHIITQINFRSYEYIITLSTILLLFRFANKRRCIQLHVLQSCDCIYIAMSPWLKFVQTTWFYILFYGSVIFLNRFVITNLKVSYSRIV